VPRTKRRRAVPLPNSLERALDLALDKAMSLQRPVITAYLDRVRGRRAVTPGELLELLEKRYLAAVGTFGAAAGSAAAVPGIGTVASVGAATLEVSAFVEATAVFALAVAEVHGVPTHDPEYRRALILGLLIGDRSGLLARTAGGDPRWGEVLAVRGSKDGVSKVNHMLMRHFVTRFGATQGALALGRTLPLGVGAGIGAAGNIALGRGVIANARRAFGPPPAMLPPRIIDVRPVDPRAR
jgi:hypothetical protein